MPSPVAAVLMCAGITVYTPLRKYLAENTQKIAIVGVGGLGHLAIQFAHALGYEVSAISSSPDQEAQAFAFGADHFIAAIQRVRDNQARYRIVLVNDLVAAQSEVEA